MKNLLKSNKFTGSFFEVLSSPVGDENVRRSNEPFIQIKLSNPLKDFDGSLSTSQIAGV